MEKYFEKAIKAVGGLDMTEDNKRMMTDLLENLLENLEWTKKTREEKQLIRIIYLSQLYRANIKQNRLRNLEKNIMMYGLILETMPYFIYSGMPDTIKIINFCHKILDEIDFRRDGEVLLKISKEEFEIFNSCLNYTYIPFIQSKITKLYNHLLEFVDNE